MGGRKRGRPGRGEFILSERGQTELGELFCRQRTVDRYAIHAAKDRSGSLALRFVVQPHHLIGAESDHGVGAAFIVGEFDFEDTRGSGFHHRAYLATRESLAGHVFQKSHDG